MTLRVLPTDFAVCQVTSLAGFDLMDGPVFVAHTDDELSLVCEAHCVPDDALAVEPGWRAMKIEGVLDFSLLGILAGIAQVLATAGVSVFVVSTFNTDYILVKAEKLAEALQSLQGAGYTLA